jgi:phytoene dehydrogenase-like protein
MANIAVVGAGHNGLVCAYYLARAGHEVSIFEQSPNLGGACRNERWNSGAVVSPGANHYGMLNRRIAADMGLWQRGLSIIRADPQLIVGLGPGESLCLFDDVEATKDQLAHYNEDDAARVDKFFTDVANVRRVIQSHIFDLSPSLDAFVADLNSIEQGLSDRFVINSIDDTLTYYFKSAQAKALFSATTFLYNAPPDEPGTAFTLAYLSLFDTEGSPGWGIPVGGMGRVTELMTDCVRELGVTIFRGKRVEKILIEKQAAVGVKCVGNEIVRANFVVSNADPYSTYVILAGQSPSSLKLWDDSKFSGPCAKFNFTYRGAVRPTSIRPDHEGLLKRSAYVYLPTIEYAAEAFHSATSQGYSANPYFEFVSPSEFDNSLCSVGTNIGSIYCLFANYDVISSWNETKRSKIKSEVFQCLLEKLNITDVPERELLDPVDIEFKFGMHKGNVDHGSMMQGNTFENRNIERRFGIDNLIICGSGSHPGGLVSGVPGFNAAQRILLQLT